MAGLISKLENTIESEEVDKLVYMKGDDGSYMGWKTQLLTEEITDKAFSKFLLCSYCGGVLRDACLFEKDGKQEFRCSVCIPEEMNKQIVQMNRESVSEKQVYCPLKSKGCSWGSELSELLHHLEDCGLFPVACPLGCRDERGEVSRVERREVETHKTCCLMRTVHCEYCAVDVKSCEMNQHLEGCEEFPVPCPNECGQGFKVKRKEKPNHLSEECPLQLTECPYSQYGCEVKVHRMNLDQHEKEDMHKHYKLSMINLQIEVTNLQKEKKYIHGQLKLTVDRVIQLEKENEILRTLTTRGSLEWTISGVKNRISRREYIFSDPFYVGLYKLQGWIEWNKIENFVSIFFYFIKGEWDDILKWPIRCKYDIVLINPLEIQRNYHRSEKVSEEDLEKYPDSFKKPGNERSRGYGFPKFISHTELLKGKYSKDDCIKMKVSVEEILAP